MEKANSLASGTEVGKITEQILSMISKYSVPFKNKKMIEIELFVASVCGSNGSCLIGKWI